MIEHKHTDECLKYAAVTGMDFCIVPCRDTRVTIEARLRECVHAILKLPEPPKNMGDGPDERVGNILEAVQAVTSRLREVTKAGEELIDERDEIIANLAEDLEARDAEIASIKGLLEERNNQYHMVCAKVLSREALIKGLADDYDELEQTNKRLENKVFSYVLDAEGGRISWRELEADKDMICIELEESLKNMEVRAQAAELAGDALETMLQEAREKLKPEFTGIRIGYPEGFVLDASNEALRKGMEMNLRAAQHAEGILADIRERAERIVEGENWTWTLVSFILRKTDHIHKPDCWKNTAFREIGVGGRLVSCTCRRKTISG